MIKIFGLAFLFAMSSFVLKTFGWRGAPLVTIAALIGLFSVFFDRLSAVSEIFLFISREEGMGEAVECVLKILGIGYVSGMCADVCRELGEPTIASAVISVARIESIAVISPMIMEILTLGVELVE